MGSDDGGLDVDGMVPHPPQLHGLLQSSHHKQSIVSLCWGKPQAEWILPFHASSQERNVPARTPVCIRELGAAEEAQVARPGPDGLRVSKAKPGVEVVGLEHLLPVTAVVAAAVVGAVHPDLQEGASTRIQKPQEEEEEKEKKKRGPTSPR